MLTCVCVNINILLKLIYVYVILTFVLYSSLLLVSVLSSKYSDNLLSNLNSSKFLFDYFQELYLLYLYFLLSIV